MDEHEANVKITRIVTIGLTCVAFTIITSMAACEMQEDQLSAGQKAAETAHLKVKTEQEKEQNRAIQALIDNGINPIAARCAIIGWKTEREAIVCSVAGADKNGSLDNIKK